MAPEPGEGFEPVPQCPPLRARARRLRYAHGCHHRAAGRPARALQAKTVAEAFQPTAEAHPDRVALRTKGDEFSITWGEYAEQVEDIAAGLAGLGIGRGDTVAIMLTNRPEFHSVDSAAMHLGATPFSIYNTYTPEQIKYLVERRRRRGCSSPSRPSSTRC